ncbi:hypothetical protein T4B_6928 [Trichinella pseudospiralis]|uniref:Uncharacterized protein n=1 Tax=Trichinella pseudospiralis TaxID=6337 RepID=A0A0V1JHM2_TRIPS|nr:hypothetical protein T4B_6928 [Trichinella pseudospiralis]KRZ45362.1 hypothetical protein T4C_6059 [Trichinella pseudospiralis]
MKFQHYSKDIYALQAWPINLSAWVNKTSQLLSNRRNKIYIIGLFTKLADMFNGTKINIGNVLNEWKICHCLSKRHFYLSLAGSRLRNPSGSATTSLQTTIKDSPLFIGQLTCCATGNSIA